MKKLVTSRSSKKDILDQLRRAEDEIDRLNELLAEDMRSDTIAENARLRGQLAEFEPVIEEHKALKERCALLEELVLIASARINNLGNAVDGLSGIVVSHTPLRFHMKTLGIREK